MQPAIRRRIPGAALLAVAAALTACSGAGTSTASGTQSAAATPSAASTTDPAMAEAWGATAAAHRGMDGEQFGYDCPARGELRSVWGTDVYTDDSSVCSAAVHAGAITVADGGSVLIEIRPGEDEYVGSERNGVESSSYGPWGGSFVLVDQ